MARTVVVVEYDGLMQRYMHLVLHDAGYSVTTLPTFDATLSHLRTCIDPTVVVVANVTPDNRLEADFFATVTAEGQMLTRHRYVLLTTTPEHVPPTLQRQLAALHAPILKKPFTQDQLLAVVQDAARFPSVPETPAAP